MARPRLSFEAPAPLAALAPLCNPDTDGGYPVVVIYFACFSLHHAESHLVAFPVDLGVTCHPPIIEATATRLNTFVCSKELMR